MHVIARFTSGGRIRLTPFTRRVLDAVLGLSLSRTPLVLSDDPQRYPPSRARIPVPARASYVSSLHLHVRREWGGRKRQKRQSNPFHWNGQTSGPVSSPSISDPIAHECQRCRGILILCSCSVAEQRPGPPPHHVRHTLPRLRRSREAIDVEEDHPPSTSLLTARSVLTLRRTRPGQRPPGESGPGGPSAQAFAIHHAIE